MAFRVAVALALPLQLRVGTGKKKEKRRKREKCRRCCRVGGRDARLPECPVSGAISRLLHASMQSPAVCLDRRAWNSPGASELDSRNGRTPAWSRRTAPAASSFPSPSTTFTSNLFARRRRHLYPRVQAHVNIRKTHASAPDRPQLRPDSPRPRSAPAGAGPPQLRPRKPQRRAALVLVQGQLGSARPRADRACRFCSPDPCSQGRNSGDVPCSSRHSSRRWKPGKPRHEKLPNVPTQLTPAERTADSASNPRQGTAPCVLARPTPCNTHEASYRRPWPRTFDSSCHVSPSLTCRGP